MFKGYIEGYYSRRLPIDAFKDLKTPISHYFYGPKEDIFFTIFSNSIFKSVSCFEKKLQLENRIKIVNSL